MCSWFYLGKPVLFIILFGFVTVCQGLHCYDCYVDDQKIREIGKEKEFLKCLYPSQNKLSEDQNEDDGGILKVAECNGTNAVCYWRFDNLKSKGPKYIRRSCLNSKPTQVDTSESDSKLKSDGNNNNEKKITQECKDYRPGGEISSSRECFCTGPDFCNGEVARFSSRSSKNFKLNFLGFFLDSEFIINFILEISSVLETLPFVGEFVKSLLH